MPPYFYNNKSFKSSKNLFVVITMTESFVFKQSLAPGIIVSLFLIIAANKIPFLNLTSLSGTSKYSQRELTVNSKASTSSFTNLYKVTTLLPRLLFNALT